MERRRKEKWSFMDIGSFVVKIKSHCHTIVFEFNLWIFRFLDLINGITDDTDYADDRG
jgi:hypothetical protein